jgi:sporulation protein YlmC with PRC-barrel domain
MPEIPRIDEFAFVLLAGLILIIILAVSWSTMYGVLEVSPTEKTLTIARGSSASFVIHLNGNATNVNLTGSGEIANWLSFNRNNFDVFGPTDVLVTVSVPYYAQLRFYTGRVEIEFIGGKKSVSVTVNVSTVTIAEVSRRVFGPEDFTVSYSIGTETVSEKKSFTVEKGLFVDRSARFVGTLTDEKLSMVTGGFVELTVDDTNLAGNLIVELNGEKIFDDKVDVGKFSINLDKSQIQKINVIVIKAGSSGWKFWVNNYYEIGSAKFGIDYRGVSFKDFSFSLDSSDIANFKLGRISFIVRDYDPKRLNDLIIKINNQTVFKGVPTTYFSETFGSEVSLNEGSNTISFSVEKEAFYDLKDVTLTIVKNI